MESKGDRMEKTAMVRPVIMVRRVTERTSVRWLNRFMNGTVSESVNDPVAETMIAMMCSAGASSPIRPVYKRLSACCISPHDENETDQGHEDLENAAEKCRPNDERAEQSDGITP